LSSAFGTHVVDRRLITYYCHHYKVKGHVGYMEGHRAVRPAIWTCTLMLWHMAQQSTLMN